MGNTIIIKPLIMQRIAIAALLLLAIVSIVYGYNKDPKSVSAYEPDGNLKMDTLYQKDGTDSVFRYFRSTGQSKYLYRNRIAIYNTSGLLSNRIRFFADTLTPTTGNGQTVNISAAGFTRVLSVQAQIHTSTTTANDVPIVAVKDFSNTQVTLNIVQGNTTAVSILGVNVLGLRFLQTPASSKIHLLVVGY